MEHGCGAFIDSRNYANTFVNYTTVEAAAAAPLPSQSPARGGSRLAKNWKERKYGVAQITSIK